MFNHLRKAVVAALAAGALMLAGGAAHATTAPDSIVDTNKTGTIYLTKYDDGAGVGKLDSNGSEQEVVGANAIDGIKFTLQKIKGVDFSTNEGLKAAAVLDPMTISEDKLDVPEGGIKMTANGGKITWTNLKVGAYLLKETESTVGEGTEKKTYKKAAPSIIFLPTTNPKDHSSWITDTNGNYAVYVYPKNSLDENVKSVVDEDANAGADVTFKIEASMPTPGRDEKINDFAFYDKLDPALDIKGKEGNVTVKVGDKDLAKGTHFDIKITDGGENGQDELVVVLNAEGLKLATEAKVADSGAKAVMTFKAKVLKSAVAPNQAQVFKNTGKGDGSLKPESKPTPEDPWQHTNTTVSAWGRIQINKQKEDGEPLDGAKFQLYKCTDGTVAPGARPISVNGETVFTDKGEGTGIIEIDGIRVTDVQNNGAVKLPDYCLVEKEAPTGYELRHDPIKVNVTLGGITKATEKFTYDAKGNLTSYSNSKEMTEIFSAEGQTINVATDVVNIPVKPKLPMTGGAGVALFGILGLAIIGGGVYAAKRNTKKA
ncbi:SpaH/EbpB family LPXTG-anchored major pilin [Trueperella pyogenes]|uniref:SpaH/EbpB family LPXTG-anchored major pilin n=1 Tax=Trueperella pyogenes TaxID=1661 RepID=UPI00215D23DB|nr:SpaH/EbpB family LPXTG-anchored major pilin [Trueperella pyogenes]UVJ59871.1 SpaH/EbpB family LPXTG-anchored major pilin [Trueperella pyogenes]